MPLPARLTARRGRALTSALLALALTGGLAGCGKDDDAEPGATASASPSATPSATPSASPSATASSSSVEVKADDDACDIDPASVPAGTVVLKIENTGEKVTEVYVYTDSGTVVSERENITAGKTDEMTVTLAEGEYEIACKPGMTGDGIRKDLKVTAGTVAALSTELQKAVDDYRAYVAAQVDDTIAATEEFVEAVKAGDVDKAKKLYAPSRFGWESIEPVAESFGDLDPRVDAREADLESGDTWTGWHKIEKALWADNTTKDMAPVCDQLLKDLEELRKKVPDAEITPAGMANGAKELLDEVASGKITGEEEAFSHTDLTDFKANLDGAKKVFDLLRATAEKKDPALVATLAEEFDDVYEALKAYEKDGTYVSYDAVTETQRKELTNVVNALAEPLSKLAAAVV